MQTFLPYPDFKQSLRVLDYRRLGKQRVESSQILAALSGESHGWRNHPATLMWKGYETALATYYNLNLAEWERRGYSNVKLKPRPVVGPIVMPSWFSDDAFHASHRSNLLRKAPEHYAAFGWTEPDNLEYIWPSHS